MKTRSHSCSKHSVWSAGWPDTPWHLLFPKATWLGLAEARGRCGRAEAAARAESPLGSFWKELRRNKESGSHHPFITEKWSSPPPTPPQGRGVESQVIRLRAFSPGASLSNAPTSCVPKGPVHRWKRKPKPSKLSSEQCLFHSHSDPWRGGTKW